MGKKQTATKTKPLKVPKSDPEPKVGKMMAIIGEVEEIRFIDDLSELQNEVDMEEYCEMDFMEFSGKTGSKDKGVDIVTDSYHTGKCIMIFKAEKKNVIRPVRIELEQRYVITKRGK